MPNCKINLVSRNHKRLLKKIAITFSLLFANIGVGGPTAQSAPNPTNNIAIDSKHTATQTTHAPADAKSAQVVNLPELCMKTLSTFPGKFAKDPVQKACDKVQIMDECVSVNGVPIYHYEKKGIHKSNQRILVFSLIHGDEVPAGSVGRFWMERLEGIEPRNTWRVVPVLNPDGLKANTRTNAHKVDINRNFPTKDWTEKAQEYWKKDSKSNPRRFPGDLAASEPETKCAMKHIEDFKADMIVSIHTPLKVLDFDGPEIKPPNYDYLPWKSLGHYPGSLGRYMWFERKIPVLTMEMKEDLPRTDTPWLQLQDVIGFLVSLELGQNKHTSDTKQQDAKTPESASAKQTDETKPVPENPEKLAK